MNYYYINNDNVMKCIIMIIMCVILILMKWY